MAKPMCHNDIGNNKAFWIWIWIWICLLQLRRGDSHWRGFSETPPLEDVSNSISRDRQGCHRVSLKISMKRAYPFTTPDASFYSVAPDVEQSCPPITGIENRHATPWDGLIHLCRDFDWKPGARLGWSFFVKSSVFYLFPLVIVL